MAAHVLRALKSRLLADRKYHAYGAFVMSGSSIVAELMARAGYDFLVVDLEHSPLDVHGAVPVLQAIEAAGRDTILRVAMNRPELIKKALDLGPAGLIVPLVDSAADAQLVAKSCRFPPAGIRGVAYPIVRASGWGMDSTYAQDYVNQCLVLCQIETLGGLSQVDAILEVEGVDGIFVGPMDLAAALGHLGDPVHPEVIEAMKTIEAAAARHPGKILAGFSAGVPPVTMFSLGYQLVAGSADVGLLRRAAVSDVESVPKTLVATSKM